LIDKKSRWLFFNSLSDLYEKAIDVSANDIFDFITAQKSI
jgi:hypothetical protein